MTERTESTMIDRPAAADSQAAAVEKRRRLLKAGMGGSAILATLKSRSTLACTTGGCTTPSAYGSINSSIQHKKYTCNGLTPGYWKQPQHYSEWPNGYYPVDQYDYRGRLVHAATKFGDCFSPNPFGNKTLRDAMAAELGGTTDLGMHVSAALLNAAKGLTPVLSVNEIKEMWTATCNGGYYHPTPGIDWDASKVVEYLKTTMH